MMIVRQPPPSDPLCRSTPAFSPTSHTHTHTPSFPVPFSSAPALARGLESVDLPDLAPPAAAQPTAQAAKLAAADAAFEASPLLKELRERSDANRAKNRRAIENKYCARQAELGIGDCGGLKYIPGATKGGKQKTPGWLARLVGADPDKLAAAQDTATAAAADAVKALREDGE